MKTLGQFCSIARALDTLGERWSLLIVREVLMGERRFGDIRRGIPRISPTMLSARLRELTDLGVLSRSDASGGPTYELTESGRELEAVIRGLGVWGQRWLPRTLPRRELDLDALLWDMRRQVLAEAIPGKPIVVRFEVDGAGGSRPAVRYLLLSRNEIALCAENPGFPEEVCVRTTLRTMTAWWRGDLTFAQARADGLSVSARREWVRAFPTWFRRYAFAGVEPA